MRMLRQQWDTELAQIPRDCLDEDTTDHREKVESELTHINKGMLLSCWHGYLVYSSLLLSWLWSCL